MANVKLDLIADVSVVEEFGELIEAVRGVRVKFLRSEVTDAGIARFVLDQASVPQPGAAWDGDNPDLKVEHRAIDSILGQDEDEMSVHLLITYRMQRSSAGFDVRGGVNTIQGHTEVMPDGTTQIIVSDGDQTQGASVDIFEPEVSQDYDVVEATNDPFGTALLWINKVNDATFRGGAARTWRVAAVSWEPANLAASPKQYHFTYQLAYIARGQDPVASYVDENGEIPDGLTIGTAATDGIRTLTWYTAATFTSKFT